MTAALKGVRGQRHALAALYPRERPGTHCTEGCVGPRAGLDRCGKFFLLRDSIPGPSSQSLYRLRYPANTEQDAFSHNHFINQNINPLNAELNPICRLLALLGSRHILHVSRIKDLYCFAENQPGYTKDSTWRANIDGLAGGA